MNATIAEFLLRQASDAAELAQRAKVLAALTQLPPRRQNELAEAVNMVCRTIAAHGGRGKVQFSLVQRGGHRYIEVSVCDQKPSAPVKPRRTRKTGDRPAAADSEAAVIQRVGQLVDHFETSGWPVAGAVIRMAQALSPAFSLPTQSEVAEWAKMIKANSVLDALAFALRRVHSLESALDHARYREDLRTELEGSATDSENLIMLSLVINKTKNAISIMEPSGAIVWVNDAFVQMTGYGSSEAIGSRPDELLFGPSTEAEAVQRLQRALVDGQELTQDVLQYRQDGRTYWVESSLIPVRDAAGAVSRWIAIDTDITKRRQTEEALRAAKEIAEANSRSKTEFLANVSHEIRTPMNAIIGMTELALATELSDEQRDYLRTVRSSAEALLVLLNDILDLSKIEAGKLLVEEIDFQLASLVRDTVTAMAAKAREKGIEVAAHVPGDIPSYLRGDPTRLRQILFNLVGNAVKFTQQGEVAVQVEEQWRSDAEIGLHFSVRDTGVGIPPDKLDKIFEAFAQSDASTSRRYGGSGLGLTITSELVRLMNGRVWVQSTVGEGSTFHFTVRLRLSDKQDQPETDQQPVTPVPDGGTSEPAVRSLSVLIADDHDANRSLAATVLSKRGHRCAEAVDGREAIQQVEAGKFDVVLMDVQMPGMDGFEATSVIRAREQATGEHLPIIALTAHAMSGDREKCLAAGMDAYLAKPLHPRDLVALVEDIGSAVTADDRAGLAGEQLGERPEFDLSSALKSLDNDRQLLIDQMRFFLNDGPQLVQQMRDAMTADDPRGLELAAHRLKGMLARYAFHDAAGLAYDLEQRGKNGELSGAEGLCQKLAPMVERLAAAIRQYIARHEATS